MIQNIDIIKYLTDIIDEIVLPINIDSVVDNLDGTFTISTCNTQYLQPNSCFEVDGKTYFVEDIKFNESITLQGDLISESFNLKSPLFIPDTPIGANNELVLRKTELDRHPFIWLVDNFENNVIKTNSLNISESSIKLFFLTHSNNKEWLHQDHRNNCVRPMKNLCNSFINDLEFKLSGKITDLSVKNLPRFGVYVNNKGNKKTILDEELSGLGLDISVPIRKWAVKCKSC